jgi:hypothetical protein
MSTVSESLSILTQVDTALAWESQSAISLLIHRVRCLDAHILPQVWFPIPPYALEINVTGAILQDCLQTLYSASDGELMPFRAAMEVWIFTRFRILPYVQSLPNEDLPCQIYLIQVTKNLDYTLRFYRYVWSRLLVELSHGHASEALLLGSGNLRPTDSFVLVIVCRYHALRYVQLFPDAPLVPESGDRRNTHVKAYVESCGHVKNLSQIKTFLNIGRKLLAIERGLDCPGIALVMFLSVQSLAQMQARDIYQMIQLLGLFGRFPSVTRTACWLSSDLQIYQEQIEFNNMKGTIELNNA